MCKLFNILTIFLTCIFILSGSLIYAQDQDFELNVDSAILIETNNGQVLYEKNADERMSPASITKIMTLLLAMEKIESGELDLDDKVNISKHAESMGGSQIFLAANTSVKVRDLLKAITIASANDASVAIAEAIGGSYNNFINLMNKKAEELGMGNTYFSNSTGLPTESDHYTTARDITKMARELVKYKQVLEWAQIWVDYIELPNRKAMISNTNKLVKKYPGIDGLKTGHTDKAGFCLTATAKRDMRLISVVLKAKTELEREELTARLLDYGFNRFTKKELANKGQEIQNISVPDGKKEFTAGMISDDLEVVIKRGEEDTLETKVEFKEGFKAPIKKGDLLGYKFVIQDGKKLASANIVATEDISRANIFIRLWRTFVNWIGSFFKK